MNQFKKAKQLRMESGQTTESITDLKTAGVAQKNETELAPEKNTLDNEKNEKPNTQDNTSVIQNIGQFETPESSTETKQITMAVSQTENKISSNSNEGDSTPHQRQSKDTNIIQQVDSVDSIIEETAVLPQTLSEIPNQDSTDSVVSPEIEADTSQSGDTAVINTNAIMQPTIHSSSEPVDTVSAILQPVPQKDTIQAVVPPVNPLASISPAAQIPAPIMAEAAAPIAAAPTDYYKPPVPQSPVVSMTPEPSNRQQLQEQNYREVPSAKSGKTAKKSVPNIFAPKSEAKSMRKSLVLKPTSVKIAENYCSKNGGSFNELIQTLLDNFIDEYGL